MRAFNVHNSESLTIKPTYIRYSVREGIIYREQDMFDQISRAGLGSESYPARRVYWVNILSRIINISLAQRKYLPGFPV